MYGFPNPMGVIPFHCFTHGVSNGPAMFQHMISWVLRDLPHVVVYIDDVLVGTSRKDPAGFIQDHRDDIIPVLDRLRGAKLGTKGEKVHLFKTKIKFLGHILCEGQRRAAPSKLRAIREWRHETITTVRRLKSFMGLAQHYSQYIQGFADIAMPLTEKMRGALSTKVLWTISMKQSFEKLKQALLENVVLDIADPMRPYVMETDASDYAVGGVLSQHNDAGELRPVAFFSRKLSGSPGKGQMNWSIREKETYAIVLMLLKFRS